MLRNPKPVALAARARGPVRPVAPPAPGAVRNPHGWCTEDASAVLGPEERRAYVAAIMRVASRAQYAKSASLAHHAAVALSTLAYIEPGLVLPLVHSR